MKYPLAVGISIMSIFLLISIIMANAQTENTMANMTSPTLAKNEPSLNIGELILESKTQGEGMKISDIDKQEFEASWSGNATLQGEIPVWTFGTAQTNLKEDGYWYDKGYGMLLSLDNSVAKYTYSSIGKLDDDGKIKGFGTVTFDTNDESGALSILKNTIGVLTDEMDQQGNAITKVWKLEK
jgi:hypothetical protein